MTNDSKKVPTFFRDLKGTRAMKAHNRNTATVALECVALGLPVVDVHSIDDNGDCTCQYGKEKRAAEGRPPMAPCTGGNRGKHPKGLGWEKGQTLDPEHIAARWTARPGYLNVGVVFGAACGVALVDVDGPVGMATAEAWQASGLLPRTLTVATGSGGLHLYYRVPSGWDIRNSVKKDVRVNPGIGPGLDVRGENGFAVGPCSRHAAGIVSKWQDGGGLYKWKDGHAPSDGQTITDAPELLLRKMWFVTKERRHLTAPDGSRWEDAGLVEQDDVAESTTSPSASVADPFAQAARAMGGAAAGWEAHIALIGHGEGLGGFDGPILDTCNSYIGKFGYEADAAPLKATLLARIGEAPENTPGHRDRYLSAEYLDGRIEQARDFVKSKGGDATRAKGPTDTLPAGFVAEGDFIYWIREGAPDANGNRKESLVKMCTRFDVIGHTLDETKESEAGLLIRYTDKHGRGHEHVILDADARSDTGAVIAKLSKAVFWIDNTTEQKQKFLTLLGRLESSKVVTTASRAGWHDGTFLTPYGKPHGADPDMRLAEGRRFNGSEDRRGTLAGWQSQAADLMVMMDFHGTVLLCASFAGVLIDLLKHDTCGIAVTGETSRGKTLSQRFGATVWGDPALRKGVFVPARGTANGIELSAARSSGTCLHIDEMKGAKAAEIGETIMTLAAGVSKIRMDGVQGEQTVVRWHTYFTQSAEESIRELIEGGRSSYVTGFGVRAVEIDTTDAAKFEYPDWVETFRSGIGDHWGHAGPAFVDWLIWAGYVADPGSLLERLAETTAWILDGDAGGGAKGRAAGVLAYAMLAGEIAQEAGIVPVEGPDIPREEGRVRWAFRKAWLASWGRAEGTPENGPEAAFTRLQGVVAQEWHLHAFDAEAREDAEGKDYARPGDGEPKLGKWFHHGDKCVMKDANGAYTVPYVAVTTESFRHMAKTLALGVKTDSLIRWAAKTGKLIPRDAEHLGHLKLAGYGAVPNFRFHLGVFGPGTDDQDDDGPLSDPYRQAAREGV